MADQPQQQPQPQGLGALLLRLMANRRATEAGDPTRPGSIADPQGNASQVQDQIAPTAPGSGDATLDKMLRFLGLRDELNKTPKQ